MAYRSVHLWVSKSLPVVNERRDATNVIYRFVEVRIITEAMMQYKHVYFYIFFSNVSIFGVNGNCLSQVIEKDG